MLDIRAQSQVSTSAAAITWRQTQALISLIYCWYSCFPGDPHTDLTWVHHVLTVSQRFNLLLTFKTKTCYGTVHLNQANSSTDKIRLRKMLCDLSGVCPALTLCHHPPSAPVQIWDTVNGWKMLQQFGIEPQSSKKKKSKVWRCVRMNSGRHVSAWKSWWKTMDYLCNHHNKRMEMHMILCMIYDHIITFWPILFVYHIVILHVFIIHHFEKNQNYSEYSWSDVYTDKAHQHVCCLFITINRLAEPKHEISSSLLPSVLCRCLTLCICCSLKLDRCPHSSLTYVFLSLHSAAAGAKTGLITVSKNHRMTAFCSARPKADVLKGCKPD